MYSFVRSCHVFIIRDTRVTAKGSIFSCTAHCFSELVKICFLTKSKFIIYSDRDLPGQATFTWPVNILWTKFNQFEKLLII